MEDKMAIIDMAKAHIQNVVQRIEELTRQQQLIQNEVEQLKVYVQNAHKEVQDFENSTNDIGDK